MKSSTGTFYYHRRQDSACHSEWNARVLNRAVLTAGLAALLACHHFVDPVLPANARQFSPPIEYSRWWDMAQACSGISASIASISWFEVPGTLRAPSTGEDLAGYWSPGSNRIVVAEEKKLSGGAVRHEMLHALLQTTTHPRNAFLGRCAGIVDCVEQCIADAGPPPSVPEGASEVTPDFLEIEVDVTPESPTMGQDDGAFTITVAARNPAAHPVVVVLTHPAEGHGRTFWFDIRAVSGGVSDGDVALDNSVAIFSAGETKRKVFDFRIGNNLSNRELPPDTYTVVRGAYGEHWTTHAPIVIQR